MTNVKIINERSYNSFFTLNLQNQVCILVLQHISVWTSPASSGHLCLVAALLDSISLEHSLHFVLIAFEESRSFLAFAEFADCILGDLGTFHWKLLLSHDALVQDFTGKGLSLSHGVSSSEVSGGACLSRTRERRAPT